MSRYEGPIMLGEREAEILFSALPADAQSEMDKDAFAKKIVEILAETGDIKDARHEEALPTKQGLSNGIEFTMGSKWKMDDAGHEIAHFTIFFSYPSEEGEEYIKNQIKERYPGFREDIYRDNIKNREQEYQLDAAFEPDEEFCPSQ